MVISIFKDKLFFVPMFQVVYKIKATRVAILKWLKVVFQGRREKINEIRLKLGFILA